MTLLSKSKKVRRPGQRVRLVEPLHCHDRTFPAGTLGWVGLVPQYKRASDFTPHTLCYVNLDGDKNSWWTKNGRPARMGEVEAIEMQPCPAFLYDAECVLLEHPPKSSHLGLDDSGRPFEWKLQ